MTEKVNPRFFDFDLWSSENAVEAMYEGQLLAMAAIKPAVGNIARAADAAAAQLSKNNGRLVYVGAGTSGRLAVQDGAELGPTFGWPQERMVFCMAGGMDALTISAEGAEDSLSDGASAMAAAGVGETSDVVIGVAASGRTPFTLGALQEANTRGVLTIGIVNNRDTPILAAAGHGILAETGSEIIAGSTRMKAGTAQKAILNMLSTAVMTRMGHVFKGYMVDMIVSNKKLEDRAVKMVCAITGCVQDEAASALARCNMNIKCAVLVALGQDPTTAKIILEEKTRNLRQALEFIDAKIL